MDELQKKIKLILSRLGTVESKIDSSVTELRTDLREFKDVNGLKVGELETKVDSVEKSKQFVSSRFENHKKITDSLLKRNSNKEKELTELREEIKILNGKLDSERIKLNELAQYGRRNMAEPAGIPITENENSVEIVTKIAKLAKMTNCHEDQIDVAHPLAITDKNPNPAIIIMFKDRSSKENFCEQKWKLKKLHVNQIIGDDESYPTEGERKDSSTLIYLNEPLTPQNRELLRHTQREAKVLSYKYV